MSKNTWEAKTIQEVVDNLETIIRDSEKNEDPLGYFAALYQTVTITVRDKIGKNYFENDPRMEHLDVVFANRYLKAYSDFKSGKKPTKSWQLAFDEATNNKLIVLQHLLLGMNAHINLDLGIAAAEISTPENIADLEGDFNKINELLGSLVTGVQDDLAKVYPLLTWILKLTKRADDLLVNFSMEAARNGAWNLAKKLVGKSGEELEKLKAEKDTETLQLGKLIVQHGLIEKLIYYFIRIWETGKVANRIQDLHNNHNSN